VTGHIAETNRLKAHVAGGGDIEVARYLFSATASKPMTDNVRVGLGLTYEFEDYSFSGLTRFGGQGPWNRINRVGFGGGLTYRLGPGWNLLVSPSIQFSGEEGADVGRSLVWGGVLPASYQANPRLRIGLGAGIFSRMEQTSVFFSLAISWKITDRLTLGNPFRTGPTGPAGLELGYTPLMMGGKWLSGAPTGSPGLGWTRTGLFPAAWTRQTRCRFTPVWVASWGEHLYVDLYAGAAFAGTMRLMDRSGDTIDTANHNVAHSCPFPGGIVLTRDGSSSSPGLCGLRVIPSEARRLGRGGW
jgi:hypothetical protein